jgi:hypothetical protein
MVAHGRPITLCADGQWAGVWNLECLTDDEAVAWGMGVAMKIRPSPRERRMGRGRDPPHLSLPSPDCWPRGQATRSPGLMSAALTGTSGAGPVPRSWKPCSNGPDRCSQCGERRRLSAFLRRDGRGEARPPRTCSLAGDPGRPSSQEFVANYCCQPCVARFG